MEEERPEDPDEEKADPAEEEEDPEEDEEETGLALMDTNPGCSLLSSV